MVLIEVDVLGSKGQSRAASARLVLTHHSTQGIKYPLDPSVGTSLHLPRMHQCTNLQVNVVPSLLNSFAKAYRKSVTHCLSVWIVIERCDGVTMIMLLSEMGMNLGLEVHASLYLWHHRCRMFPSSVSSSNDPLTNWHTLLSASSSAV